MKTKSWTIHINTVKQAMNRKLISSSLQPTRTHTNGGHTVLNIMNKATNSMPDVPTCRLTDYTAELLAKCKLV